MTTPMRIFLCSNPIALTLELDANGNLQVLHRGTRVSSHEGKLEIFLEDEVPVTLELLDFVDAQQRRWTVEATTVVQGFDGTSEATPWHRAQQLCHCTLREAEEPREILVTATHEPQAQQQKLNKSQIFLVRVLPEGAKPNP